MGEHRLWVLIYFSAFTATYLTSYRLGVHVHWYFFILIYRSLNLSICDVLVPFSPYPNPNALYVCVYEPILLGMLLIV
jgi:hypothetical protein